jgi:hypothetical protein
MDVEIYTTRNLEAGPVLHDALFAAKGYADCCLLIPASTIVQCKRSTGLFGWTVGVGCRTAMFTDQVKCGSLMEWGATGCGIMTAAIESLFRKRISPEEVQDLSAVRQIPPRLQGR